MRSAAGDAYRASVRICAAGCLVAALVVAAAAPAGAATRCPAGAGANTTLGDIDGETRLAWIDTRLSRTARRARLYTWGWGVGIVGATVGNLVPLAFVSPEDRVDWYTGAGTTIIGIVPLLIAPLDVVEDAHALHAGIAAAPAGDDVCLRLADAETRLVRDAKNQEDGQRWWLHVANVALNTGVGLFLGLGFHHWGAGALNAVTGVIIGELIIYSQPTETMNDLRRYRDGALGDEKALSMWGLGYSGRF